VKICHYVLQTTRIYFIISYLLRKTAARFYFTLYAYCASKHVCILKTVNVGNICAKDICYLCTFHRRNSVFYFGRMHLILTIESHVIVCKIILLSVSIGTCLPIDITSNDTRGFAESPFGIMAYLKHYHISLILFGNTVFEL